jgi:predicted nucleotidyltransferase
LSNWYKSVSSNYQKCLPRIKDIKLYLPNIIDNIKKIDGIKEIYIWGSYSKNHNNPNYRVKDIDILVKTDFNSGDLIAIDEKVIKEHFIKEYLEKEGYNPIVIKFSEKYLDFKKYNIDHWAISSDKKILHWGPILPKKEDGEAIKKDAEKYTIKKTGYNLEKLNNSTEKIRSNWYKYYCDYINQYFIDMPSGWYKLANTNIKKILANSMKM